MSERYAIRGLESEDDHAAVFDLLMTSFNASRERSETYVQWTGGENVRVLCRGAEVVGCIAHQPMGQFLGGRSVPMVGVAIVAVVPEERGRGAGGAMMRQTMRELAGRGVALSALYPATLPIYRRVGYELAGHYHEVTLPLHLIEVPRTELQLRPIEESDREGVESAYREEAARHDGMLDRNAFIWMRVRHPRTGRGEGYLVERDGRVEGAITFSKVDAPTMGYNLVASDVFALSADAARAVLRFLALHRSMAETVTLQRSPRDPLFAQLQERGWSGKVGDTWMLRVVDVEAALRGRGYAAGVEGEVHLEVRDELVAANNDRFVLRVAGGRGEVERGGTGALKVDVRGLAALYSGYRSAVNLVAAGLGDAADEGVLAGAAGVFACGEPWMADRF